MPPVREAFERRACRSTKAEDAERVGESRQIDPAAYEAYLRGIHLAAAQDLDGIRQAIALFRQAISVEPDFVEAYGALSKALLLQSILGFMSAEEVIGPTREAAERALELDPNEAEARAAAAIVALNLDYDFEAADQHVRAAVEANPNSVNARTWQAWFLAATEKYEEALEISSIAVQLDPLSQDARDMHGDMLSLIGRYEDALAFRAKTLELYPEHSGTLFNVAMDNLALRRPEIALEAIEGGIAAGASPALAQSIKIRCLAMLGRAEEASAKMRELESNDQADRLGPSFRAVAYAELGEMDKAYDSLEIAFEERDFGILTLRNPWRRGKLNEDRRFEAFIERIGFPEKE